MKQALVIYNKILGENHPYLIQTFSNLATLYNNQDKYAQAEIFYEQAIKLSKELLGENHPNTKKIMQHYLSMKYRMS